LAGDATPAYLYIPELPDGGVPFLLPEEESHYVTRVCRARAGERVQATDGRGTLARLRLVEVRGRVLAEVESSERCAPARRARLLCGAPEGDRGDWLVEKLAELGLESFDPVDTDRGRWPGRGGRKARWERLAVAALRQCQRTRLMAIAEPRPLADVLAGVPAEAQKWLADISGVQVGGEGMGGPGLAVVVIGPSGGLSPDERSQLLATGFTAVRLADARLRTETAALAWAALWAAAGR